MGWHFYFYIFAPCFRAYTHKQMSSRTYFTHIIIVMLALAAFTSCTEYQKVLKTRDNEAWYKKGMEYYERGDYVRASTLLGGVIGAYGGTIRSDTIIRTYAKSLMEIGDYITAAHYFQNYVKTFPSSDNCEECQYLCGMCHYNMSPKVLLDQSDTERAIEAFQAFVNMFPESELVADSELKMQEMKDKLAYKDYLSAKLYFNLGNYMGNNYRSAVIVAQNCLKKYPDTKYREELSFLILEAKFIQAERSIVQRQSERYRDAIDEYYAFINEYPQSRYSKDAVKILEQSNKGLRHAEKLVPPSADDLDYYRNYGRRLDAEAEAVRNREDIE